MSSTYRLICVSHDPAIIVSGEGWPSPEPAQAAILAELPTHPKCHLVVGRYSVPLVEVWSPLTNRWINVEWLRLLALASRDQVEGSALGRLGLQVDGWPKKVAQALRIEMEMVSDEG